jgi:hypothetical protein
VSLAQAEKFIKGVLSHGEDTHFVRIETFDEGYFRVVFDKSYFILPEGVSVPSKSQWNTLKKRAKRMDDKIFILKEHGETQDDFYYLDFGFFKD